MNAPLLSCPSCQRPWQEQPFCPNDGALREAGAMIGGRYQLEKLLGTGGMGFVYAGRHKLLGKPVALKVLRSELEADADQVARFLREAQLCSQLRHQNIVEITDFGRDDRGYLFLVMDLLVGSSLAELLAEDGRIPLKRALKILRQLCRALSCAHEAGVVHRDLTPRNIFLVTESGRDDVVKLLDFGISRTAGGLDRITSTGIAVGTTPYMPPEQLRGIAEQGKLVDIYALGVVAYELLTGAFPFQAQNQAELIAEKLSQESINLQGTDLDASAPAIAQLISECLAPDPRLRPSGAAEVEQRLLSSGGNQIAQTEDLVGARVGSYRLVRLLGSGGVGSVWQGEHPVIGSQVAIKILHPEMCESEEAVRRFVVEAQAVNRIDSPHIIKTFDFGKLSDGRDYAVMELLKGDTLGKRIANGPLSWREACPIAIALAHALVSAHEVGIVHRDLKPENIHVGRRTEADGATVKVLDFGIAKLLGGDVANTHRTQLGICIGTPLYAAPEQMSGESIGPEADIYALGVVLFEMLTGEPPFTGTIQDLAKAKLSLTAPSLAVKAPRLPKKIAELVNTMLLNQPAERPTIDKVLISLRETPLDSPPKADPLAVILAPGLDHEEALRLSEIETRVTPGAASSAPSVQDAPPAPIQAPGQTRACPPHETPPAALPTLRLPRYRSPLILGVSISVVVISALIILALSRDSAPNHELETTTAHKVETPKVTPLAKTKTPAPRARSSAAVSPATTSPTPSPAPTSLDKQVFLLRSNPPDARVTLRGKLLGQTPVRVRLTPQVGSITVVLKKTGYDTTRTTLRASGPHSLTVQLRPKAKTLKTKAKKRKNKTLKTKQKTKTSKRKPAKKTPLVDPFDE
ncbi:MAG: protein kinase [Deltaproteobacteria bacterium]|nr:protein kinase [Deltaproteobacteria bacterium]